MQSATNILKIKYVGCFIFIILFGFNTSVIAQETAQLVDIETNYGTIRIKLYDETPLHRDNFIKLVKEETLNGTLFHRVIKDFMIQGGDPSSKGATPEQTLGNGGPGYTIPAEFNNALFHKKGSLCAARQGDNVNPAKESSGSQFYIVQGRTYNAENLKVLEQRRNSANMQIAVREFLSNPVNAAYIERKNKLEQEQNSQGLKDFYEEIKPMVEKIAEKYGKFAYTPEQIEAYSTIGGTPHLDGSYTVFGEVVSGIEVLDKIAAVSTGNNDRPVIDVLMKLTLVK